MVANKGARTEPFIAERIAGKQHDEMGLLFEPPFLSPYSQGVPRRFSIRLPSFRLDSPGRFLDTTRPRIDAIRSILSSAASRAARIELPRRV